MTPEIAVAAAIVALSTVCGAYPELVLTVVGLLLTRWGLQEWLRGRRK